MSKKKLFQGFSDKQQKQYEREARLQWGPDKVNESIQRWEGYSKKQRKAIQEEGGQIYLDLAAAMKAGKSADSADVHAILGRWHQHIYNFYEPTLEILRGLGQMYNEHPDFNAFFTKIHPDLPAYLQATIAQYVDDLETAEIERMLAAGDAQALRK